MVSSTTETIVSIISIFLSICIITLYYKKRISIVEAIIYCFGTETWVIFSIGPTINPTFFLSFIILIDVIVHFSLKNTQINKFHFILIFLPLLASLFGFIWYKFDNSIFSAPYTKGIIFYTKPLYFYLKNYLPLFALGYKVYLDRIELSYENYSKAIIRVMVFSCFVVFLQILVTTLTTNVDIARLVGVLPRYMGNKDNTWGLLRVSAYFNEPKIFAAFLGISIPILLKERNFKLVFLAITIAILTISQTFWVIFLSMLFSFFLFGRIKKIRIKIAFCLVLIIGVFISISKLKEEILLNSSDYNENVVFAIVAERAISRFENSSTFDSDNEFLGMPLQIDMEYPLYEFIKKYPYLILTGYGPGNLSFINPDFYFGIMGNYIYNERINKYITYNINMRWYYWITEVGIFSFFLYFFILTNVKSNNSFVNNYYSFLWLAFFFTNIDILIIVYYLLVRYKK